MHQNRLKGALGVTLSIVIAFPAFPLLAQQPGQTYNFSSELYPCEEMADFDLLDPSLSEDSRGYDVSKVDPFTGALCQTEFLLSVQLQKEMEKINAEMQLPWGQKDKLTMYIKDPLLLEKALSLMLRPEPKISEDGSSIPEYGPLFPDNYKFGFYRVSLPTAHDDFIKTEVIDKQTLHNDEKQTLLTWTAGPGSFLVYYNLDWESKGRIATMGMKKISPFPSHHSGVDPFLHLRDDIARLSRQHVALQRQATATAAEAPRPEAASGPRDAADLRPEEVQMRTIESKLERIAKARAKAIQIAVREEVRERLIKIEKELRKGRVSTTPAGDADLPGHERTQGRVHRATHGDFGDLLTDTLIKEDLQGLDIVRAKNQYRINVLDSDGATVVRQIPLDEALEPLILPIDEPSTQALRQQMENLEPVAKIQRRMKILEIATDANYSSSQVVHPQYGERFVSYEIDSIDPANLDADSARFRSDAADIDAIQGNRAFKKRIRAHLQKAETLIAVKEGEPFHEHARPRKFAHIAKRKWVQIDEEDFLNHELRKAKAKTIAARGRGLIRRAASTTWEATGKKVQWRTAGASFAAALATGYAAHLFGKHVLFKEQPAREALSKEKNPWTQDGQAEANYSFLHGSVIPLIIHDEVSALIKALETNQKLREELVASGDLQANELLPEEAKVYSPYLCDENDPLKFECECRHTPGLFEEEGGEPDPGDPCKAEFIIHRDLVDEIVEDLGENSLEAIRNMGAVQ